MKRAESHLSAPKRVFSRRLAMLGGVMAGMVSTLAGRIYYLQVIKGEKYRLLSDENRISQRPLFPSRGLILDRFGISLATNSPSYRAVLVAEQAAAKSQRRTRPTGDAVMVAFLNPSSVAFELLSTEPVHWLT